MKSLLKKMVLKSRMLKHFRKDQLIIFNYHRIRYADREILFDHNVFGPDEKRFEDEIKWIKKETRVLNEEELVEIVETRKPMKGICSMITFDDGYRDNYDLAFPLLKKYSLPAIFFIPTWSMTERKLGWWDIVSYFFKQTKKSEFLFREKTYFLNDKNKMIDQFIHQLKELEPSRVQGFLDDLSLALEVPMPAKEIQDKELMTWDQLREMNAAGMSIGSHTHDHVILSKQNLHEMKKQIAKSKMILESELERPILSLAYPVGEYKHFDYDTKKVTRELGIKIGFSYRTGVNYWNGIDPFDVKRVPCARYWENLDLPLAFPQMAFPFLQEG